MAAATPIQVGRGGLRQTFDVTLLAFLGSQDLDELSRSITSARAEAELDGQQSGVELVSRVFVCMLRMGSQSAECLTFATASLVMRGVLSIQDLCLGVSALLLRLTDLVLDAPHAPAALGGFLAHLTQEDVLPDSLLLGAVSDSPAAAAARAHARDLLSSPCPLPLSQLRAIYRDCVEAYFDSGDLSALELSLAGLHARHTTHEVVRKVVQHCLLLATGDAAAEASAPFACECASDLLRRMHLSHFLLRHAAVEGFLRLLYCASDFSADAPAAASAMIPRFIARAMADGVLPLSFLRMARAVLTGVGSVFALSSLSPPRRRHFPARDAVRSGDGGWRAAGCSSDEQVPAAPPAPTDPVAELEADGAHATRVLAAAMEAVRCAEALVEGGGGGAGTEAASSGTAQRLAHVWGYTATPLTELRAAGEAAIAAALVGGAADAAESFVARLAAMAPSGMPDILQAEFVYALALAGAGGPRAKPGAPTSALACLVLALQRRVLRVQPAARAFARMLQVLEETAEGEDGNSDEEGLLASGARTTPELVNYLQGMFSALRGEGARSLDLLVHPSQTLSTLLSGAKSGQIG